MVFSTKKYEKFSVEGALRRLDPSHSKILGTPLTILGE